MYFVYMLISMNGKDNVFISSFIHNQVFHEIYIGTKMYKHAHFWPCTCNEMNRTVTHVS